MEIVEWILWGLVCGWTIAAFLSFFVDVFRTNPFPQPVGTYLVRVAPIRVNKDRMREFFSMVKLSCITCIWEASGKWQNEESLASYSPLPFSNAFLFSRLSVFLLVRLGDFSDFWLEKSARAL